MELNHSPSLVRGACGHDCPDTCSWIVEVHKGQATRLYGDSDHPFTRGTLCAKVNHYLERVYHPDRVLQPLRRVGAKGEGRFEPTTWDEALAQIAARWNAIIATSGAEAILPYSFAGNQGLIQMESLDRRLNHKRDWRPFANGGFPTPSGKAHLWSDDLRQMGIDPLPVPGDVRRAQPGELQLITGKALHFLNSSYCHIDLHRRREGTLFIELHPDDAAARGLSRGELVRVANEQGAVVAECRVSRRVRPGVVWMPFGGFGDAAGNTCSVNALTPEEPTDWGGGSGFYDAFVEISPIRP